MLKTFLHAIVSDGTLVILGPGGSSLTLGEGEPRVAVRIHDRRAYWELGFNPDLKLGELYMDGRLTIERGDIVSLMDLLG
jgi:cyclopropane-fatty-acyl-phospholipid synthase